MTCFRHFDILAKTRGRVTTATTFSRQKVKLAHARTLLSIEKISYSQSYSSQNLKVSYVQSSSIYAASLLYSQVSCLLFSTDMHGPATGLQDSFQTLVMKHVHPPFPMFHTPTAELALPVFYKVSVLFFLGCSLGARSSLI